MEGQQPTSAKGLLLYSGRDKTQAHESGVGFLLSDSAKKTLISWKPVSDRIITARCKVKIKNITFIQCYAPTEPAQVEDKQNFYGLLNRTLNDSPKGDITIIMGDMNAKIGSDNNNLEEVMGKHGLE
ncbi:craniofacial development protein 2-like [Sitophilus oryzae]|uniref:Craniofacial development protein 2-like n=1 Tax=Sitophilus oryzae TaxID=7048 RepID=A0A6J2XLW2_SITOR|nr:craniofacial development protein 2-like [Sitophilus oryzae]